MGSILKRSLDMLNSPQGGSSVENGARLKYKGLGTSFKRKLRNYM